MEGDVTAVPGNWELIREPGKLYTWIPEPYAGQMSVLRLEYDFEDSVRSILRRTEEQLAAFCRSPDAAWRCFLLLFRVCEKPVSRVECYKGVWDSALKGCGERFNAVAAERLELPHSAAFLSALSVIPDDLPECLQMMWDAPLNTRMVLAPRGGSLQWNGGFLRSLLRAEPSGGNDFVFFDCEAICRHISCEGVSFLQINDCGDDGEIAFYWNRREEERIRNMIS